ncbi:MAG: class I SAM-dependent methyltransferase [Symploca sp. SIO1B1]|nr:class I SAM-dependent methyltransferase [Symploca sp. SIO1B1]
MNLNELIRNVEQYYNNKILTYGATAKGVDWNSKESQLLRFEQLLKICDGQNYFSINDYGCGYGALPEYMTNQGYNFTYFGYDISSQMLSKAQELYKNHKNIFFYEQKSEMKVADFTVASGVFNVKQQIENIHWENYILETLTELSNLSLSGFAFNVLTKYSDCDKMRSNLYYGDPCFFFNYCKIHFAKNVALLHDYNLYEFTIIVKK